MTTYLCCSRCGLLSDRRFELRRIVGSKRDPSICASCVMRAMYEEVAVLEEQMRREAMPLFYPETNSV